MNRRASGAQSAMLPDGRRLHLHHGPIDLIIEAFGQQDERRLAYRQAAHRFETILQELVDELPALRSPCGPGSRRLSGIVARRMEKAAHRLLPGFITPMAAVAGAVADEVLDALTANRRLERAYVNNGGDVAVHLSDGTRMEVAIASSPALADRVTVRAEDPSRGLATSGWRGRSLSLGIADSVTALADTAAQADAAATVIANAVDLPRNPNVQRRPARELDPDSDLGGREVTVAVGTLTETEVASALDAGLAVAEDLVRRNLVHAAVLFLAGQLRCTEACAAQIGMWPPKRMSNHAQLPA